MKRLTVRDEKSGVAYFQKCFDPCDGRCSYCEQETDYCETLAAYEDTGLSPEQIVQLHNYSQRWKTEAQIHAAVAGELKVALGKRLEKIRYRKSSIEDLAQSANTDLNIAINSWKARQLAEEERWLEDLLQENTRRATGQYTEDGADQPVLMPAT